MINRLRSLQDALQPMRDYASETPQMVKLGSAGIRPGARSLDLFSSLGLDLLLWYRNWARVLAFSLDLLMLTAVSATLISVQPIDATNQIKRKPNVMALPFEAATTIEKKPIEEYANVHSIAIASAAGHNKLPVAARIHIAEKRQLVPMKTLAADAALNAAKAVAFAQEATPSIMPVFARSASSHSIVAKRGIFRDAFVRNLLQPEALRTSGFVFGVANRMFTLGAEGDMASTSTSAVQYWVGYQFDAYHRLTVAYTQEPIRSTTFTPHTIEVFDFVNNTIRFEHTQTAKTNDDKLAIPSLRYTFTEQDLSFLGIAPFVNASIGSTKAGILWSIGGGLDHTVFDHLSARLSLEYEQLNSYDYAHPVRTMIGYGMAYRW
jgi:hypothetical protein